MELSVQQLSIFHRPQFIAAPLVSLYNTIHRCLYPSRQIRSNWDHILAILYIKYQLQQLGNCELYYRGLGNITFIDFERPFKGRQQCFSSIPHGICTYALEPKRGRAQIPCCTGLTISLWWSITERRPRGLVKDKEAQLRSTVLFQAAE